MKNKRYFSFLDLAFGGDSDSDDSKEEHEFAYKSQDEYPSEEELDFADKSQEDYQTGNHDHSSTPQSYWYAYSVSIVSEASSSKVETFDLDLIGSPQRKLLDDLLSTKFLSARAMSPQEVAHTRINGLGGGSAGSWVCLCDTAVSSTINTAQGFGAIAVIALTTDPSSILPRVPVFQVSRAIMIEMKSFGPAAKMMFHERESSSSSSSLWMDQKNNPGDVKSPEWSLPRGITTGDESFPPVDLKKRALPNIPMDIPSDAKQSATFMLPPGQVVTKRARSNNHEDFADERSTSSRTHDQAMVPGDVSLDSREAKKRAAPGYHPSNAPKKVKGHTQESEHVYLSSSDDSKTSDASVNIDEQGKSSGLFTMATGVFKSVLGIGNSHVFVEESGDDFQSTQKAFRKAMKKIGDGATEAAVSDAKSFLEKKRSNLGHVVAAAYLCDNASSSKTDDLAITVFACIGKIKPTASSFRLLEEPMKKANPKPHQVMYEFLTKRIDTCGACGNTPGHLFNILCMLAACGLLRRAFDPIMMRSIRRNIQFPFNVFIKYQRSMATVLGGKHRAEALFLCFPKSLKIFSEMVDELAGTVSVDHWLSNMLLLLIDDDINAGRSFLEVSSDCLTLMDKIDFRDFRSRGCPIKGKPRETVVRHLLQQRDTRSGDSFTALFKIVTSIQSNHRDNLLVGRLVKESLRDDLRHSALGWSAVDKLFTMPLLEFLLSKGLKPTTLEFVDATMSRCGSLEEKLLLLDRLHKCLLQNKGIRGTPSTGRLVAQVRRALGGRPPTLALTECLRVAADNPEIFAWKIGPRDTCAAVVLECFVTDDLIRAIFRVPSMIARLPELGSTSSPFYDDLLECVRNEALRQCTSISQACQLFNEVMRSSATAPAKTVAEHVFSAWLRKWAPTEFEAVHENDKSIMDALFTSSPFPIGHRSSTEPMLSDSRNHLRRLADEWVGQFESDEVTKGTVESVLSAIKADVWVSFEETFETKLPSHAELSQKLDEIVSLETTMRKFLSIDIGGKRLPLETVLLEYDCARETSSQLSRLFLTYEYIFPAGNPTLIAGPRTELTLRAMKQDERVAANVVATFGEAFSLCAHFKMHPSLLFRETVLSKGGKRHSLETLHAAVTGAMQSLRNSIGLNSSYAGVRDAMETLDSSKSLEAVESEINALVDCSALQITTVDVENFRVLVLLSEMTEPIQRSIACCEQFGFTCAANNSAFSELKSESAVFYETCPDQLGIHECIGFFKRLCSLLCMDVKVSDASLPELRNSLSFIKPMLNLLSTISRYPDLWNYANEMEWFGEEGLKRFYNEYGNVTNVLLGDSASYEMSLLDAMEPTMRVISAIGTFRDAPDLRSLFESFRRNDDVAQALGGTIDHHIRQVHGKLSEIKDWFSNGVDEIAAAHSLFSAAQRSGTYFLTRAATDLKLASEDFVLTLELMLDSQETRRLQVNALDQFIQQLSLVQNENDQTSAEMQGFVDQYQLLIRASRNVLIMHSVGYEKLLPENFVCRAGKSAIDDAEELFQRTELHLQSFTSWLTNTRESYKVSLLFWTEELRDVYRSLMSLGQDSLGHQKIAQQVARLHPLWKNGVDGKRIVKTIRRVAASHSTGAPHELSSKSWLVQVSKFLAEVHSELSQEGAIKPIGQNKIVLHSLCCKDEEEHLSHLAIMRNIYKDRLPFSFEILDGAIQSGVDQLLLFLNRVRVFASCRFTIINTEKLDSKTLEKLLSFLSDNEVASLGINLHCIQRGDTLIHTAPWISGESWDGNVVSNLSSECVSAWTAEALKSTVIKEVVVVSSPSCGSGKTRFIRDKMKRFSSQSNGRQVASITVHEKTSMATLIEALNSKFSGFVEERVLHISFAVLPANERQNMEWLQEMNHFFFFLIVLRSVYDPKSATSFSLFGGKWTFFIELPTNSGLEMESKNWLAKNIPIVSTCCRFDVPGTQFVVDKEARRVCTYLRAFATGTINRKFDGGAKKRIVLVLDCSGSMKGGPFRAAVANAISIFDSHVVEGDEFGVILFDSRVYVPVPIQTVAQKDDLRGLVQSLPFYGHGTSMYTALSNVFHTITARDNTIESWVVCLTDGMSDNNDWNPFRLQLIASPQNLHFVLVGINLRSEYEQHLRSLCSKFDSPAYAEAKGFFVRSDGTPAGINSAFDVVKSCIPVSQTFNRDGHLTDDQCRQYITRYLPEFVEPSDMISTSFWVRFLYRRVTVFDRNKSFNYNTTNESLGSSLMVVMLDEVERLLGENQKRDWNSKNQAQLIYDFTKPDAPEFRLVCTSPDDLDNELREKLSGLDLPGFQIPTKSALEGRSTLDSFLSQALGVPLQTRDDGSKFLRCIDENGFILTLDFTMKLLSIHERVACRVPCVIEGETGVSKTALTNMYAILRNSALVKEAQTQTTEDLCSIERQLTAEGFTVHSGADIASRLRDAIKSDGDDVTSRITALIIEKAKQRSPLFVPLPDGMQDDETQHALDFFEKGYLEKTFFEVNVDSSLTERDFIVLFDEIRATAVRLAACDATVVVFLDEINTSSVLGLLKEVVVDHSLAGEMLEENLVVVAACNPPRQQIRIIEKRERDLGRDWASGHYQVSKLPATMLKLKWSFGSLSPSQEKAFIYRRIEALNKSSMPSFLQASLTEIVSESHELMRKFAARNILEALQRASEEISETEVLERARSVVSLRDIQRVFALFEFFFQDLEKDSTKKNWDTKERLRRAMLLAVATVYYLRLDNESRYEFIHVLKVLPTEQNEPTSLLEALDQAMDTVIDGTMIPSGIALTRGLKENIFVTLVCSLSRTPLMIVGPPGSSKTLAVNVIADNANGTDSIGGYFRKKPRLSLFHYQCSKQSTSKEISAVFEQATQRQERIDDTKHQCVVFMDEAGLPEEEKESLKVLHYLLEGHMSTKAKVGFVAISNHILDAAKSNRCVMVLRQEPDEDEMLGIAIGVLFDLRGNGRSCAYDVDVDGHLMTADTFARSICASYAALFLPSSSLCHLNTFFGLRDFIYFLKAVRLGSTTQSTRMFTNREALLYSIERNFNGCTLEELRQLATCFLEPLAPFCPTWSACSFEECFRHPMVVLKDALSPTTKARGLNWPRFKLIIDCTEDDSILRLLGIGEVAEVSKTSLYKLSNLSENAELERLRLISGVKFAALQGSFAVLSQTDAVNESFYDLFNQRFREISGRDGEVLLYANIAVGGVSRRSLVKPGFECVIHIRETNMHQIPAPFLNRFEKYRLTLTDVLMATWGKLGIMKEIVQEALKRTAEIGVLLQARNGHFDWMTNRHTIESIFVGMLPTLDKQMWSFDEESSLPELSIASLGFRNQLSEFLTQVTSLDVSNHLDDCIEMAKHTIGEDAAALLERLTGADAKYAGMQSLSRSMLTFSDDECEIKQLCITLIQMTLTRAAVFRLVQLATPESIFANRHIIPSAVLNEYFSQEHFSLKRLLGKCTSQGTSLSVIHTRSDQFIYGIPSLEADRDLSSEETKATENVQKQVYDNPQILVIEHLGRLRSDAAVRAAFQTWADHRTRNLFLMLVDMHHECAVDRVNYVRMLVEHVTSEKPEKSFVLLLHYSQSSSVQAKCYPALFLGGWNHFFLDGVGSADPSFGADRSMELACRDCDPNKPPPVLEPSISYVRESVRSLLNRVLPHIASQTFFYREQSTNRLDSFSHRKVALDRIMRIKVSDCTFADIICDKFLEIWLGGALLSCTRIASDALLRGTTQLSLSLSIQSVMMQTFHTFVGDILTQMNQWLNLDVIDNSPDAEVTLLFEIILRGLPVLPFNELVLQRKRNAFTVLRALPVSRTAGSSAMFPFFYFIQDFMNELVDCVHQSIALSKKPSEGDKSAANAFSTEIISVEECFQHAMDVLQGDGPLKLNSAEPIRIAGRCSVVFSVIEHVLSTASESRKGISLFDRYLRQFVEWKLGCFSCTVVAKWLRDRLEKSSMSNNILAIHVISKVEQMDLMKIASIVTMTQSFVGMSSENAMKSGAFTLEAVDVMFEYLERTGGENWLHDRARWSLLQSKLVFSSCNGKEMGCKLRRLSFQGILEGASEIPMVPIACMTSEFSLLACLKMCGMKNPSDFPHTTERLLEHFLSPAWARHSGFLEEDLDFLLQVIEGGMFSIGNGVSQKAVGLLRGASCFGKREAYTFSIGALRQINEKLYCENISEYSSKGARFCLPHYIPEWLRNQQIQRGDELTEAASTDSYAVFFSAYHHCFEGDLSHSVFRLLLSSFSAEVANMSSEQIFLGLARDIESETMLNRQEYTRLSRIRSGGDHESVRGTPLSAIALSARVVCFVSKVASEIATEMNASALSGVYSRDVRNFLRRLMSQREAMWQEFFMSLILRHRGEGTLSAALGAGGQLADLDWCQIWADGISSSNTQECLHKAEDALAEAEAEETRKARELRHCPHCGEIFIVAERECGEFSCGRDAHTLRGQPALNGVVINNTHGCGQKFNLDAAQHYRFDQSILGPLRERIATVRTKLERCQLSQQLWDSAQSIAVPPLRHCVMDVPESVPSLPCVELFPEGLETGENSNPLVLMSVLWEATDLSLRLSALPDLIEFYLWLNETFRFLVTRDFAFTITMRDLMSQEHMKGRFDSPRIHRILALWERVKTSMNSILDESSRIVHMQCEEVSIPFRRVENAQLVALLSEGAHPTDGNDFLFLVINETIDRYNRFVTKLSKFTCSPTGTSASLHPKFIVRGFGGDSLLSLAVPLPREELNWVAECCWNSFSHAYEPDKIRHMLLGMINLEHPSPLVSNPLSDLRETFSFRDDQGDKIGDGNTVTNIATNDGKFYANHQDAQLMHQLGEQLKELEMEEGDWELKRTLVDTFHGFSYEQLRALLEGCRSFLDLIWSDEQTFVCVGDSLACLVQATDGEEESDHLRAIGFPQLTAPQSRLILALDARQLVELINYAGYQLASEAYVFCNLPLYMTNALLAETVEQIQEALVSLVDRTSIEEASHDIEEFVRDVLSFYETKIVDGATKTNGSLRTFLQENNFCDDSDQVFAAIPPTISLRHYVSLRQTLHQIKLSILSRLTSIDPQLHEANTRRSEAFTKTTRGKCWLWEDSNFSNDTEGGSCDKEPTKSATRDQWKLWFEQASPTTGAEVDSAVSVEESEELEECELEEAVTVAEPAPIDREDSAARLLQQWWRRELDLLIQMEIQDYESDEESATHDSMDASFDMIDGKGTDEEMASVGSLKSPQDCANDAFVETYGTQDKENQMRKWLDDRALPRSVADKMLEVGVRCIEDIAMVFRECPDLFSDFAPLDRIKLKKAIDADQHHA